MLDLQSTDSTDEWDHWLPVVRVVPARGTCGLDSQEDVLAIYRDGIAVFRKKRRHKLPAHAYDPGGSGALLAVKAVGRRAMLPVGDVASVEISVPAFYGSRLRGRDFGRTVRIRDRSMAVAEVCVPEEAAENVLVALRGTIPEGRLREGVNLARLPSDTRWLTARPHSQTFRWTKAYACLLALEFFLAMLLAQASRRYPHAEIREPTGTVLFAMLPIMRVHKLSEAPDFRSFSSLEEEKAEDRAVARRQAQSATETAAFERDWRVRLNRFWSIDIGTPFGRVAAVVVSLATLLMIVAVIWQAIRCPNSLYRKKRRMERWRSRHGGGDRSHERPWRSLWLGITFKVAGVVTLVAGFVAVERWGDVAPTLHETGTLKLLGLIPATCLIYSGYRLSLRSGEQVRREDTRPPILYLRPFESDGRTNFNPKGFLSWNLGLRPAPGLQWLGPLGNVHPVRLSRLLFTRSSDHAEEQLANYFRGFGPFVAIGRPGERLSFGGAARFYVGNEDWQETVQRLIEEASVVMLQPGESEHVWWEIREVFARTEPQNVLFNLRCFDGERDQWMYERFRLRFEHEIGWKLPRGLCEGALLYFGSNGGTLLPLRNRLHLAWPIGGCCVDFARTLKPFLENHRGHAATLVPERGFIARLCSASAALVLWGLVVSCFHELCDQAAYSWLASGDIQKMIQQTATVTHGGEIEKTKTPWELVLHRAWESEPGMKSPLHSWRMRNYAVCSFIAEPKRPTGTEGALSVFSNREIPDLDFRPVELSKLVFDLASLSAPHSTPDFLKTEAFASPPPDSAVNYTNTVLAKLNRVFKNSAIEQQTEETRGGRKWLITHLRAQTNGKYATSDDEKRTVYTQNGIVIVHLYVHSGSDVALQLCTVSAEIADKRFQSIVNEVFSGLSVPAPATPPSMFVFRYQGPDEPGLRIWVRQGNDWLERYPSGALKVLRIIERNHVEEDTGTIVQAVKTPELFVFIPDTESKSRRLRFRVRDGEWKHLGKMEEIK